MFSVANKPGLTIGQLVLNSKLKVGRGVPIIGCSSGKIHVSDHKGTWKF